MSPVRVDAVADQSGKWVTVILIVLSHRVDFLLYTSRPKCPDIVLLLSSGSCVYVHCRAQPASLLYTLPYPSFPSFLPSFLVKPVEAALFLSSQSPTPEYYRH